MPLITSTFQTLKAQGKRALIPYITVGDPQLPLTVPLMHAMVHSGADIIELGVPFSDPMADGPVIQRANERALTQGISLNDVLQCVAEFRQKNTNTPVVLMGYANPVEAMGCAVFAEAARRSGVNGVITVDYPPEECSDYIRCLVEHDVDPIFLFSPTTETSRIRTLLKSARGFIYYVSLKGVTGSANLDLNPVAKRLTEIRGLSKLPIGIGFGIRTPDDAYAAAQIAEAVVIGSRVVQEIENSGPQDVVANVGALIKRFREGIDRV